jgi:phosphopantetheine adenylyltransferase
MTDQPISRIDKRIDSLQELLKKLKPDSNKVHLMYELATAYHFSIRNKEAIAISKTTLQLSKQIRYQRGECLACFILGIYETRMRTIRQRQNMSVKYFN